MNINYNYKEGDLICNLENASQRAGYVIVTGENREALLEHIEVVYDKMHMLDDRGNNMIMNRNIYRNSIGG